MVEVDPSIPVTGEHGQVPLVEVFEGRRQLIVYYHMWHTGKPAQDQCSGCTGYPASERRTALALIAMRVTLAAAAMLTGQVRDGAASMTPVTTAASSVPVPMQPAAAALEESRYCLPSAATASSHHDGQQRQADQDEGGFRDVPGPCPGGEQRYRPAAADTGPDPEEAARGQAARVHAGEAGDDD